MSDLSDEEAAANSPTDSEQLRASKRNRPERPSWWRDEFGLLTNKIDQDGGFPYKAGNVWLHEGITHINDSRLKIESKIGGAVETSTLIKETSSFYLQPKFDGQTVYAVLFGTSAERKDSTAFNEFKSTFRLRLDNVSHQDVVRFQGLPAWARGSDGEFARHSADEIYESVRDSKVYEILHDSFSMDLAAQVSKAKMSKEHLNGSTDPKFVDKYIRERLGKIDTDNPYDVTATDYTWLKDKTKFNLPITKDETTEQFMTYVDNSDAVDDKQKPSFEVELPLDGKFELKTSGKCPKMTKVAIDGTKKRATAEDILQDFPLKTEGQSTIPPKMIYVFVQFDTLQNGKYAGPGLRCNVKEIAYVSSEPRESSDDACERLNM